MKNIHVLPTDKPSKIIKSQDNDFILLNTNVPNWFEINLNTTKQNIYITSDEEIKKGDWCINPKNDKVMKVGHHGHHGYSSKKIILTTDQDLIKDGVQSIDDEFLEWLVKNPTCENVEVRYNVGTYNPDYLKFYEVSPPKSYYKIIIPKEETLTITLNKEEVRGLLNCIMRTSAKGKDLDVGEMVEDKLVEFLNLK